MLARERQMTGPHLDERQVRENLRRARLVPLGNRPQIFVEDEPRLVDPPRPEEAVARGAQSIADRVRVTGTPRKLHRASCQRKRLRLALPEADDGECRERAGAERVVAQALAEPDGLASVLLADREP